MRKEAEEQRGGQKSTVVVSILIIIICIASLVGATWALFINDPEDGTIGINVTSGQVQVDITDGEQNSLVGDVLRFVVRDGREEVYFEPGATYYTQGFQVKNTGTVPVNFRMYISEDENIDREKFDEAFELYITTDPENPENAEKLTSFTGRLETEQNSETYYLVIRMKEKAGNDFQHKTYTGIGVTVYAVQGNAVIE